MSLSQDVITNRNYYASLETLIEECYAKSTGKLVVYLEGGHFNQQFGADDFAINSLSDAIVIGKKLIGKYQKQIKLVYGILVDDLGIACSEESCTITQPESAHKQNSSGVLPEEIENFIQTHTLIKRDKLMIFSERTSKNRAIESIKKKLKGDSHGLHLTNNETNTEIKVCVDNTSSFLLAKKQGNTFTAKCPAIIFQHYKDVHSKLKKRFGEASNFLIIDWSDLSDRSKVIQGRTALTVMQEPHSDNITIANVFFGDDEGHIAKMEYRHMQFEDISDIAI